MAKTRRRTPRVLAALAAGLLVVIAAVWGYSAWSGDDKESSASLPTELSYEALKAEAQKEDPTAFMEKMHQTRQREDLTEQQRREAFDNVRKVWESMLDDRIDEYYAAADDQKNGVLDRQIDEFTEQMERMRAQREQWERERAEREAEDGEERGPESRRSSWRQRFSEMTPQQRKERSESRDPDRTARRMAYFTAVRQRMAERGIEMPFGRGRGRGSGPPRGPRHP